MVKSNYTDELELRIQKAVDLAGNYGTIDGGHHKMWVIDQMVRALLTEKEYDEFRKDFIEIDEEYEDEDDEFDGWDEGCPP